MHPLLCERKLINRLTLVKCSLSRPMHLSFDIDSIDPVIVPSTGTPGKMTVNRCEVVIVIE
jgi:arginase family enzyme